MKIKVIIKDKYLLELAEDAKKGDLIDLKEVVEVDTNFIEQLIESGRDKVYEEKLQKERESFEQKKKLDIALLKNEFNRKESEFNNKLSSKEQEVKDSFINEIHSLKEELRVLKETKESDLDSLNSKKELEIRDLKLSEEKKYDELRIKYEALSQKYTSDLDKNKLEVEKEWSTKVSNLEHSLKEARTQNELNLSNLRNDLEQEKHKEISELKDNYNKQLNEKTEMINNLQRQKSSLNVKQTGEDLESWCDNEVTSYMQNGLLNCTWTKDNKVVRDEDEVKGSKADYIFKVYADNTHNDSEELASVCLDMKDENPDSVNKKTNADYYKKLDQNRVKKNCKYAVLVSNLEMDKPNDTPIFKVREYENMYVVRPAYLMTFLNMITSLTTRFAELVLAKEQERIEFKDKIDILDDFDSIKNTYLDKPLESLKKSIDAISSQASTIRSACDKIDNEVSKTRDSYINQIMDKINRFEIKLNKDIKKM